MEKQASTIIPGSQFSDDSIFCLNDMESGSMEPAFQRGDILFLNNQDDPIRVGEIVVFKIKDRDIPIVHRVMKVHEKPNGEVEILTKGDNNRVDDRGLYAPGQLWLKREDILGRARGTLRYLGMVTIILNDYPVLKYVLIGVLSLDTQSFRLLFILKKQDAYPNTLYSPALTAMQHSGMYIISAALCSFLPATSFFSVFASSNAILFHLLASWRFVGFTLFWCSTLPPLLRYLWSCFRWQASATLPCASHVLSLEALMLVVGVPSISVPPLANITLYLEASLSVIFGSSVSLDAFDLSPDSSEILPSIFPMSVLCWRSWSSRPLLYLAVYQWRNPSFSLSLYSWTVFSAVPLCAVLFAIAVQFCSFSAFNLMIEANIMKYCGPRRVYCLDFDLSHLYPYLL
eukprot:gene7156-14572_t